MYYGREVITCYQPFVRGIHWSPVDSHHKGQWCGVWCFLWFAAKQTVQMLVIWTTMALVVTSLCCRQEWFVACEYIFAEQSVPLVISRPHYPRTAIRRYMIYQLIKYTEISSVEFDVSAVWRKLLNKDYNNFNFWWKLPELNVPIDFKVIEYW